MRLVLQRVTGASVRVSGKIVADIDTGLLVLVGFGAEDGDAITPVMYKMIEKMLDLRIFSDDTGKMNRSLRDITGDILLVSQFTLYASCRKGRRPSFSDAAPPDVATRLFDCFVTDVATRHNGKTASGIFGADMDVSLTNQGPVTIVLDSRDFSE
ncbi:D-aminoacyl-tRNA deacylase [Desulfovibrio inopinatus]|uniref:D-aminoacyl-tRNA deacylase n=1 Tax=Desulfovibrio inopinatus TaxID=102109 RepID=UPI0003F9E91B|nr:D-aminoacyl-tRNA deacylase [Desulfovibrio inopinatus]